jgi:hypothetical protein
VTKIPTPPARHNPKNAFQLWLFEQSHRADPIGDLAQDALRDGDFPTRVRGIGDLLNHLDLKGACTDARRAAVAAWREWMASR